VFELENELEDRSSQIDGLQTQNRSLKVELEAANARLSTLRAQVDRLDKALITAQENHERSRSFSADPNAVFDASF
jgi:predicted RNase H-like nuclease (RuvC/YqgF family)